MMRNFGGLEFKNFNGFGFIGIKKPDTVKERVFHEIEEYLKLKGYKLFNHGVWKNDESHYAAYHFDTKLFLVIEGFAGRDVVEQAVFHWFPERKKYFKNIPHIWELRNV